MLRCLLIDIHIRNLYLVYESCGCHQICHMESLLGYPRIFWRNRLLIGQRDIHLHSDRCRNFEHEIAIHFCVTDN